MQERTGTNSATAASATPSPVGPEAAAAAAATDPTTLGPSFVFTGDIAGQGDLSIEGRIEGTVDTAEHAVTIGSKAVVKARITARTVMVSGTVHADIKAASRVEIRRTGSVEGSIVAPCVVIADGAIFRGSIDMTNGANGRAEGRPDAAAFPPTT